MWVVPLHMIQKNVAREHPFFWLGQINHTKKEPWPKWLNGKSKYATAKHKNAYINAPHFQKCPDFIRMESQNQNKSGQPKKVQKNQDECETCGSNFSP
jgi:hypothetical protein